MFDIPVLETVSLAPTIIINSASQLNKIAALSTPKISSPFLNTAAVINQSVNATGDDISDDSSQSKSTTLLPQGPFQLLEPLNLADVTEPFEKIFELPLSSKIPAQSPDTDIATSSSSDATDVAALQITQSANGEKKDISTSIDAKPVSAELKKSTPAVLRNELKQCIHSPHSDVPGITTFKVLRQGDVIGEVSSIEGTEQVRRKLEEMLAPDELIPDTITPVLGGEEPAIRLSSDVLVNVSSRINDDTAEAPSTLNSEWAAITWSDQLRKDLGAAPLDAGDVEVILKGLQPSVQQFNGTASWYGPYFHGRLTANGEIFDQNTLTAAHKSLPFNTVLQVRNLQNNRSVVVRINDRGPYIGKRSLDLSKAAAQCLGSEKVGIIPYEAVILDEQPDNGPTS